MLHSRPKTTHPVALGSRSLGRLSKRAATIAQYCKFCAGIGVTPSGAQALALGWRHCFFFLFSFFFVAESWRHCGVLAERASEGARNSIIRIAAHILPGWSEHMTIYSNSPVAPGTSRLTRSMSTNTGYQPHESRERCCCGTSTPSQPRRR